MFIIYMVPSKQLLISEDAKAVLKKAKELLAERSANNVTLS